MENAMLEAMRVGEAGENSAAILGGGSCQRHHYRGRPLIGVHADFCCRWHPIKRHQLVPNWECEKAVPTAFTKNCRVPTRQSVKIWIYINRHQPRLALSAVLGTAGCVSLPLRCYIRVHCSPNTGYSSRRDCGTWSPAGRLMHASWRPVLGFPLPLRGSDDTGCLPASRGKRTATGCISTIRAIRCCPRS